MIIPESALPWIQLHRTAASGDIAASYTQMVLIDYDEMIKGHWLPERCNAILDIGCGMAGIDVLLHKHYESPLINLLDGSGRTDGAARINFHPEGMKPFNDMTVTQELLFLNGIQQWAMWPVGYSGEEIPCDL